MVFYMYNIENCFIVYTRTYTANNIGAASCKTRIIKTSSQQFKTRKNLFYKHIYLYKIVTVENIEL